MYTSTPGQTRKDCDYSEEEAGERAHVRAGCPSSKPSLSAVCTYSTPRLVGQDSMGLLIQIKPGPLTSFLLFL